MLIHNLSSKNARSSFSNKTTLDTSISHTGSVACVKGQYMTEVKD